MPQPSITIWNRLEPIDHSADLSASLRAPIADPLWLVLRQWQLAELEGNDAGSPIAVTVTRNEVPLSAYRPGDPRAAGPGSRYDPASRPLEPLIEAERVRGLTDRHRRLAAETGAQWLRMLKARGFAETVLKQYRTLFAIQLGPSGNSPADARGDSEADPIGAEARRLLDGRAIDGDRLAAELRAARDPDGRLTHLPPSFPDGPPGALAVANDWLRWYDDLLIDGDSSTAKPAAWQPRRLEYGFSTATRSGAVETTFGAVGYDDGHLDWPDLSSGHRAINAPPVPATTLPPDVAIPVPLSYPGMPAHRYWEIEDAQINFAAISAGSTDVVRMLLMEFALVYGDDWFLIPFVATVGSLVTVQKVEVRDTFGVRTTVPPAAAPAGNARWAMYAFTRSPAAATSAVSPGPNSLLIPPSLPAVLNGAPIEETAFFRDELANLVWAVERTTSSPLGTAVDRYRISEPPKRVSVDIADLADADLVYRLTTPIPGNWYPYLPKRKQTPGGEDITLERQLQTSAQGEIVRESSGVEDEEVSRGGPVVERSWQFARWTRGQSILWLGRRVKAGRGEGSSGLAWDVTEPPPGSK